jgi:hypothetical protein
VVRVGHAGLLFRAGCFYIDRGAPLALILVSSPSDLRLRAARQAVLGGLYQPIAVWFGNCQVVSRAQYIRARLLPSAASIHSLYHAQTRQPQQIHTCAEATSTSRQLHVSPLCALHQDKVCTCLANKTCYGATCSRLAAACCASCAMPGCSDLKQQSSNCRHTGFATCGRHQQQTVRQAQ